jgi:hypothetical protein
MRNPKISAARSARAEYRQRLKRLADDARKARNIYAESLKELASNKFTSQDFSMMSGEQSGIVEL